MEKNISQEKKQTIKVEWKVHSSLLFLLEVIAQALNVSIGTNYIHWYSSTNIVCFLPYSLGLSHFPLAIQVLLWIGHHSSIAFCCHLRLAVHVLPFIFSHLWICISSFLHRHRFPISPSRFLPLTQIFHDSWWVFTLDQSQRKLLPQQCAVEPLVAL